MQFGRLRYLELNARVLHLPEAQNTLPPNACMVVYAQSSICPSVFEPLVRTSVVGARWRVIVLRSPTLLFSFFECVTVLCVG